MPRAVLMLAAALLLLARVQAQSGSGRIHGDIWSRPFIEERNQFGRIGLPGCELTFHSKTLDRKATTDKDGRYAAELPAGRYGVSAVCPRTAQNWDYYPALRADIEVKPGADGLLNLMMAVKHIKRMTSVALSQQEYRKANWRREELTSKVGADPQRVLMQYITRISSRELAEYHGRRDYRQDALVSLTSDLLAIYADTIAIEKPKLRVRATGHVIVEDGAKRYEANEVTIDFDAADPLATLKIVS